PIPLQAAPPATDPAEQTVTPAIQRLPGGSFDQTVAATQPPQGPTLQQSMIPRGMSKQVAWRLWQTLGPQAYGEKVLVPSALGTTDFQNALKATNGDPDVAGRLMLMRAEKEGYIAPIEVRQGNLALDPRTKQLIAYNPSVAAGTMPQFDSSNQLI